MNLRKKVLEQRKSLSPQLYKEYCNSIEKRFLTNFIDSTAFFIYLDYNSEVATGKLIKQLLNSGKRVFIPKTYPKMHRLRAVEIREVDFEKHLSKGFCAIYEPSDSYCVNNFGNIGDIDVIVCPGSVFDERGGRTGYGGGYYDRFLSQPEAQHLIKVGFAFDFQVFEKIILQKHDVKMDFVVTNNRLFHC